MPTPAPVRLLPALVLCALLLCALTLPVRAATLYVSPNGSDDNSGTTAAPYKTIQAAVNNASSGDTIALAYAIYQGNGNRDIDFAGKSLSIVSQSGPGRAVIDFQGTGQEPHSAFSFHSKQSGVLLDGLTIKNGSYRSLIKIEQDCTIRFNRCAFRDNAMGCISNTGAVILTDCLFLSNHGGGCIDNAGTATLTGCTFTGNISAPFGYGDGGGVSNSGTATLTGCTFTSNTSNTFRGGGGVHNGGTATLTGCTCTGNTSSQGSGVSNEGTAVFTDCTFNGNTASESGGGVYNNRTAALTTCDFIGNIGRNGGGVSNGGDLLLTNCTIHGNTVTDSGAGIRNGGKAALRFCTIEDNSVKGTNSGETVAQGGGLENDGTATLTDDILWGNTAPNAAEIGTPVSGNQTTVATYCDVQGGLSGLGNIKTDPRFMESANSDLHLQSSPPCRGAGVMILPIKADPNQPDSKPDPGVLTDADEQKRPNPPSMGAYEYSANPPKPKKVLTLDVGTANAAVDVGPVADAAASPGAVPQAPGTQGAQEHPAMAAPPAAPQPRLTRQQENAAFLQLMVTLNTGRYDAGDMAQRIQAELDRGADINVKDSEGFPAIVTAASLSHADVVQVLLEKGADASLATEQVGKSGAADSTSILHKTANGYQVDIGNAITSLFGKKPKPLFGQTALMFAAQSGQAEMVTLLLTHHADSHAKDSRGRTAADYAGQNHHDDVVTLLRGSDTKGAAL